MERLNEICVEDDFLLQIRMVRFGVLISGGTRFLSFGDPNRVWDGDPPSGAGIVCSSGDSARRHGFLTPNS